VHRGPPLRTAPRHRALSPAHQDRSIRVSTDTPTGTLLCRSRGVTGIRLIGGRRASGICLPLAVERWGFWCQPASYYRLSCWAKRAPLPAALVYQEQIPGWPTTWPMEWQNCPFWQTVFDGPQAHGADDGCSALQDIAGGLGLATCRPLASASPTDMAIARKAIVKVFSIVSSSLDDVGHGFPLLGPDLRTPTKTQKFGPCKLVRRGSP